MSGLGEWKRAQARAAGMSDAVLARQIAAFPEEQIGAACRVELAWRELHAEIRRARERSAT